MPSRKEISRSFGDTKSTCEVRILIVVDGRLSFNKPGGTYDLGHFCKALAEPSEVARFEITTAHRSSTDMGATIPDFKFTPDAQLKRYHEIWLLGDDNSKKNPSGLGSDELDEIIEYMDAGGGIVAAGDHEDIGWALCGEIPRVRSMRKWKDSSRFPNDPLPGVKEGRLDTVVHDPGYDIIGDDFLTAKREGDLTPKRIYPKIYTFKPIAGSQERMVVHPIFSGADEVLNILPDHMHEGECMESYVHEGKYGDDEYNGKYRDRLEYPSSDGGHLEKPSIIAWALSTAQSKNFNAARPRLFGCASVYDGHNIKLQEEDIEIRPGRIITVSTWHNFVSGNIGGFADDPDSKEYKMIKQYYKNIAEWVAHTDAQKCMRESALVKAATYYPLADIFNSVSIADQDRVGLLVDKAYTALRMLVAEERLLDWSVKCYNEKEPEYNVYLQAWSQGGNPSGIYLETTLGTYLFSKSLMGAKVLYKMIASMKPDEIKNLFGVYIKSELDLIKLIVGNLLHDIETISSRMKQLVGQLHI